MKKILYLLLFISCTTYGQFHKKHRPIGAVNSGVSSSSLLTGINSYWKLDEASGDAIDQVAAYHAVVQGGVTQNVAGKINTAYTFNGTTGDLLGGAIFSSSVFSFALWIKTTATGNDQAMICATDNFDDCPYFKIEATTGNLKLTQRGTADLATSTTAITAATWTYVAVTYDGSGNIVFYVNGVAAGTATSLVTWHFGNMLFGTQGNGGSEWQSGTMDEIGIWNRVLTSGEISTLYNSGTGLSYPF